MPGSPRSARPQGEEGFILIAAIWLLILAGSIAAILMARSLSDAKEVKYAQEGLQQKLALESAVETVFAERLFNGPRSRWWLLPTEGSVDVGERRVTVRITSESGRLDINEADPALIDSALRGFGLAANERRSVIDQLIVLRTANRRVTSFPEMDVLLATAVSPEQTCFKEHLTIASGLAEPRAGQMSARLAKALGDPSGRPTPAPAEPGASLRFEASLREGPSLLAIARLASQSDQPLSISAWQSANRCPSD